MIKEDSYEVKLFEKAQVFLKSKQGITWAALLRNPTTEKLGLHQRADRPCYGEIRRYGPTSTRPLDNKPGDLTRVIGANLIREALGIRLYVLFSDVEENNAVYDYLFSQESPYRRGVREPTFTKADSGHYDTVMLTDTSFDPTVLSSLLILFRSSSIPSGLLNWTDIKPSFFEGIKEGLSKEAAIVRSFLTKRGGQSVYTQYYLDNLRFNYKRFAAGETQDLTGGTWQDQYDYNRPHVSEIFRDSTELALQEGEENFFLKLNAGSDAKVLELCATLDGE